MLACDKNTESATHNELSTEEDFVDTNEMVLRFGKQQRLHYFSTDVSHKRASLQIGGC